MSERQASRREVAELVGRIGRIAYSFGGRSGLTPAQWTALRFFARANRFSRTVSAFAEFHSTTRGTASQTVTGLVRRDYLTRRRSKRDGRSARLDVTDKALAILAHDPLDDLERAAGVLSARARSDLVSSLACVLGELAERRGRRPFGMCPSCRHLETEECAVERPRYSCRLVGESLGADETQQICVDFSPIQPGG
jgi:DNA-binding MarR family transcriptional regulator